MRPLNLLFVFLMLLMTDAEAKVTESLHYVNYEVTTNSSRSLKADLNAVSPIRAGSEIFHAHTQWHVSWHFHWLEQPDGTCKINTIDTQLDATITLPQLISADTAKEASFTQYLAALRTHELGHYAIAQTTAAEIDRAIGELPLMSSCSALEQAANNLGYSTLQRYQQNEIRYDQTTQHGRLQGAWLTR